MRNKSKNLTIDIKFDKDQKAILEFIEQTKDGKYTDELPLEVEFEFQRMEFDDQSHEYKDLSDYENVLLFGLSF